MSDRDRFLFPQVRYRGEVKPENLVFDANLQEFSQRVSFISGLESNGKLSPAEAYEQIESLWHQLKRSKNQLNIR
ncbi:hypothetical protein H6F67_17895 [Microcoleus sp. FACHB-1515]|uniref:DUF7219 family protein n=1 Tax=Cyanophyceae TaxID=3028117 RepID=UPI001688FE30|nr:hypothetical protein [Microcoleus sp. FACHB-1515]MBD2091719.1 hypothetical protein [Microcoleus sp. FACHB-1515]